MIKVADSINTLPLAAADAGFVEPSDQVLQNALEAIKELQDRISYLESENQALNAKLEAEIDKLHYRLAEELAEDRQRLKAIESHIFLKASKSEKAKIEAIKALLMTQKSKALPFRVIRTELGLSKSYLSQLINKMDKRVFEVVKDPGKSKCKVLRLKKRL